MICDLRAAGGAGGSPRSKVQCHSNAESRVLLRAGLPPSPNYGRSDKSEDRTWNAGGRGWESRVGNPTKSDQIQ